MPTRHPSFALPFLPRVDVDRRARHPGLVFCVMASVVVVQSCSPTLPGSPGMGLSTISGYVYRQETPALGEPKLADVLITVKGPDGQTTTAMSDEDGFYVMAVRTGAISISASKDGYTARPAVQFDLLGDTILNFSLMQDSLELAVAVSRPNS